MKSIDALLISVLLFSCSQSPSTTHFTGTAMTMEYRLTVGSSLTAEQREKVEQSIQQVFEEVNSHYNKWNPESELSRLNSLKAGEIAPLSPELEKLLLKCDAIVRLTHGKFDPTIEPLQQLWKSKLSAGFEPTEEEIKAIKPALGWEHIHIGEGTLYKDHDLTRLDLGGIAKGYCVDLMIERLKAEGYPHLLFEWGGEIRAVGRHPQNRPWRIFISRLGDQNSDHAIAQLELCDQAIATSGDYMQFWHIRQQGEERLYFHIIDPTTFRPLVASPTSIASASVLAPTCTLADGIAKVGLMHPTLLEAEKWAEEMRVQYPEARFWFFSRSDG